MEPFETHTLHPDRSARRFSCPHVEASADPHREQRPESWKVARQKTFLHRAGNADEEQTCPRVPDRSRDRLLVILALFLNGVGWNMAFVAGSALLTDALAPNERASVQGLADLFMGLMGALGSATGGMILGIWGFAILNAVGAVLVLGPLTVTLLRRPALSPREG
jgi:hypothetical protein